MYGNLHGFRFQEGGRTSKMKRIVTKEDYIQSLKDLHHVVYYNGKRVEDITEASRSSSSHQRRRPHL